MSRGICKDILHLFCIEKQGLALRLGKGGGAAAAFLRNQITFIGGMHADLSRLHVNNLSADPYRMSCACIGNSDPIGFSMKLTMVLPPSISFVLDSLMRYV